MSYLSSVATKKRTSQSEPIPGREKDMTRNNAGGFAFKADSWTRMERFILLGSCGGAYHIGEKDLTKQNVDNVRSCIDQDGHKAVQMIVDISTQKRAPKNDPALYALALAASCSNERTKAEALGQLCNVARIGTHLFQFVEFVDSMRGWGRGLRSAVADWYTSKTPEQLAYQVLKYQQRNGWSHKDVLRLSHVPGHINNTLLRWVVGSTPAEHMDVASVKFNLPARRYGRENAAAPLLLQAFESAKSAGSDKEIARLIQEYGLTREMIPTEFQKSPAVWDALLEKMPMTAMIRTLGRMGASGLVVPFSEAAVVVCNRLTNVERLHKSGVHPLHVLTALLTYKSGHGLKGSLTWPIVPQVVDALEKAFYLAFDNVPATNKRFCLGIDVSGSMTGGQVAGIEGLTPNMVAAAMAMQIVRREPNYFIGGFSHVFVPLNISKSDGLAITMIKCQMNYGGTDASIAITHALQNKYKVDAFVILSDGESWAGSIHAAQALERYRQVMSIDAKLICVNMVANHTQVTDPKDAGSLDVVGFDAGVPQVINSFLGASTNKPVDEDAE